MAECAKLVGHDNHDRCTLRGIRSYDVIKAQEHELTCPLSTKYGYEL